MEHSDSVKKVLPLKDEDTTSEPIGTVDKLDKIKVKDITSPSKVKKEIDRYLSDVGLSNTIFGLPKPTTWVWNTKV